MRRISAAVLSLSLAFAQGCSDGSPAAPDDVDRESGVRPPAGARLSNAVLNASSFRQSSDRENTGRSLDVAFASASTAYFSAVPGTFPDGVSGAIRNVTRNSAPRSVAIVEGGFDPVAIDAAEGDEVSLTVNTLPGGTMAPMTVRVPPRRPPGVVRTKPPKGRTDVALNVQIEIVFTEPVDKESVTSSTVLLTTSGSQVASTIRVSHDGLTIEIVPDAPLEPGISYSVEVGVGVRDLDGEALAEPFVSTFTTIPALRASSELVFAQGSDGQIYRMRLDGAGLTKLTTTGRNLRPVWSPDGSRIAFVRNIAGSDHNGFGSADIYSMDPDGGNVVRHTSSSNFWFASWSPDGRRMVVSNEFIYWSDVFIIDLARPDDAPVHLAADAASPAWSPDGKQIVFVRISGDDGYHQLFVIDPDGTNARALTEVDPGAIYRPVWSPDGSRIAFSKCVAGECNIYIMNADGSSLAQITDVGTAQEAAWSSDGEWLAVALWEYAGGTTTTTMAYLPSTGGAPRNLLGGAFHPSWKP